ncbi:Fungal Zn(2)-Cys(6) binuclear cluster domain [Geosmithia morbida]|uniref:Fungal Zn(2)-Cys(6) binuclear cluster domain n=1 Tax=Geosmithia morbida TaxID=1094350 RepID=A0A9P5D972_9HYPO|nr:Fungal Zn(2)-Cys(6) binuclear cluster domain [Geosmithia morbida]KAF4126214.1 Fungal Zn(2)-Cys(6) binuclear cluster domain [Geosmithia morbida]
MSTGRRPVCHRCAQIKQACDGNIPCSRCIRLGLPCRPRNTGDNVLPDPSTDDAEAPKARIRRVQTGCLMCKQRKKKCDEVKPRCGDCRRLCLECHWPVERPKDYKAVMATDKATARQRQQQPRPPRQQSSTKIPSDSSLAPTASYEKLPIHSTSPQMRSPVSVKQEPSAGSDTVPADLPPPVGYDALVSGVAAWQREQNVPSVVTPPWYEMVSPTSNRGSLDYFDAPSLSLYIPQLLPQLSSPYDRALLNHYSTIVSPLLSRRSSTLTNPYISYLLPMAQSNELVLHCLLGLAGNHWRKMQPGMGNRGLMHQSKATHSLACLLPHVDKTSADIALVSSLLLCMTELFDGTSEGWRLHLKGAKKLLAALRQQHSDLSTGHYKFLVRLSRFLDSAATVSTCRPPLMEEEAREEATIEGMTPMADTEDSAVYGIPKELFHLVDRINSLAEKRKDRVDAASEAVFRSLAAEVEEHIDNWARDYGGLDRAVTTLASADKDALNAALAFEHALRLRLHQVVEGYDLNHLRVVTNVEGILKSVQNIRYGSPLEPCLLFPLVMAGGACWGLEQRAVIQDRLMVMERTCGFGYVYNARDLVERVWTRRDQSAGTDEVVNWARIRYEEMHGLVVF